MWRDYFGFIFGHMIIHKLMEEIETSREDLSKYWHKHVSLDICERLISTYKYYSNNCRCLCFWGIYHSTLSKNLVTCIRNIFGENENRIFDDDRSY